jgi:predicted mannosyl-3-phosphoglycerate phosphatase (HAD superfamily)
MALIFTDVDGTLIDAEHPVPAAAVHRARERHTVVLASSRAVPELEAMQRAWQWDGALVAEDGAVIVERDGSVTVLGTPRDELRAIGAPVLESLGAVPHPTDAMRAASLLLPRACADAETIAAFRDLGLTLSPGGSWATLTRGADKGRAARVVAAARGVHHWVGIGNDGNDLPLLQAAGRAFVIRNREGHHPRLAAIPGAVLLSEEGPDGWPGMLRHLDVGPHLDP